MSRRREAASIAPSDSGKISALSAPTATSTLTGRPTMRNTTVETTMNAIVILRQLRSMTVLNVRRKETDVYADPITSVIGSAYTSVSFLRTLSTVIERNWRKMTIAFIVVSTVVFLIVGRPVKVLVAVGALNALILPLSLGAMLAASRRRDIVGDYRHPSWLIATGIFVAVSMAAMGAY